MCWSHKIHPFSTRVVLHKRPLSYPKNSQTTIKEKWKQDRELITCLLKMFHSMKKHIKEWNRRVEGKGREHLLAQQDRFYPLKNPIFLVTATEANSVYFVLNDCWKTFQKYCYSQDRKVDFWMLLLFNNLYLNYIFGSSSEKFFIPVRLR